MMHSEHMTSLGLTKQLFAPGVHVCQIFSTDDERQESLLRFILSGIQSKERTSCFSDKTTEKDIAEFLGENGMSYEEARENGALTLAGTRDVYFEYDRFDPERMLGVLRTYHEDSVANGFPAARVIGEMTPDVQRVPGGERLLEYEARVSMLLREHPVSAVCQYDARSFDGAVIMDILKVHPLMVIRGSVVHNPFFVDPEEFLAQLKGGPAVDESP